MKYNIEKFINATLFFAQKVKKLGITKLNKLLYNSDFEHYRLYGRPIIGDKYIRMDQGPVPAESYNIFNANFRDNQDETLKKDIEVCRETVISYYRKAIRAKHDPDLSVFSKSEIDVMTKIAESWENATAKEISKQSHLEKPWMETQSLEIIDYKLALKHPDSISHSYAKYREEQDEIVEDILSR